MEKLPKYHTYFSIEFGKIDIYITHATTLPSLYFSKIEYTTLK